MSLRISKLIFQVVLLDEFDDIKESEPIQFSGNADSTAVEKARAWLDEFPTKLAEAEAAAAAPNRAARRARKPKATA